MDRADLLAEQLGLPIRDRRLLAQALTHTSWLHEHPGEAAGHNERLEFLGDAVINLAVSEALYSRHPDDDEGILSARRAAIVSATGLATLADRLDLGRFLSLGEGEAGRVGPGMPSILASGFEALAALFPRLPGVRQVFDIQVESVQTSCGWGVPRMTLEKERPTLVKYHAQQDPAQRLAKISGRTKSIDGLPVRVQTVIPEWD